MSNPYSTPCYSEQEISIAVNDDFARLIGDQMLEQFRPPGVRRITASPPPRDVEIARMRQEVQELQGRLELEQFAQRDWFST